MNNDLISREALKKAIEQGEGIPWDRYGKDALCVRKKYIDNAPTVDLWQMRQEATENALKKAREADKWISVKDKLPEEYGNYLVFTDDGDIDIGVYHPRYIVPQWSMCDANGFYWADDKDIKVLAWSPLPKPYEPKGGAE